MSTYDETSLSGQHDKLIVITDFEGQPVKVDNNPAHFDGLVQEIADFALRTGHFLPYLENGVALRGSKTMHRLQRTITSREMHCLKLRLWLVTD